MNVCRINIKFLKNILFPSKCAVCDTFTENSGLCNNCWEKIAKISEPKCEICGIPFETDLEKICFECKFEQPCFDKAISAWKYNEASQKVILKFKNADESDLAEGLANIMFHVAINEISSSDVVIPVPIYFLKRIKRKYNQAELLAKEICKISKTKYEPRVLEKIKQTHTQEGLSADERRKNIRGSFGINKKYLSSVENKKVLLIDDVLTTGSTVNECARVLKKEGKAKKVVVLTLARVTLHEKDQKN